MRNGYDGDAVVKSRIDVLLGSAASISSETITHNLYPGGDVFFLSPRWSQDGDRLAFVGVVPAHGSKLLQSKTWLEVYLYNERKAMAEKIYSRTLSSNEALCGVFEGIPLRWLKDGRRVMLYTQMCSAGGPAMLCIDVDERKEIPCGESFRDNLLTASQETQSPDQRFEVAVKCALITPPPHPSYTPLDYWYYREPGCKTTVIERRNGMKKKLRYSSKEFFWDKRSQYLFLLSGENNIYIVDVLDKKMPISKRKGANLDIFPRY